jgi:hypothetical protein
MRRHYADHYVGSPDNALDALLSCQHVTIGVYTGCELRRDADGRIAGGNYWDSIPLADVSDLAYRDCETSNRDADPAAWRRGQIPENAIAMLEYATFSDYSGSTVERANYTVIIDGWQARAEWLKTTYGGHGTAGIVIDVLAWLNAIAREDDDSGAADLLEAIVALEDYPLIDEDAHSELELELEEAALPDAYRDLARSVSDLRYPRLQQYLEDLPADVAFDCYRAACQATNTYPRCEDAVSCYIDIDRIRLVYLREAIARRHQIPESPSPSPDANVTI